MTYIRSTEPIETQLKKAQDLIAQLNENCRDYRLKLEVRTRELAEAKKKADHFDILMATVKENAVVKGAWDKFMMTLRMTGYDDTTGT